MPELDGRWALLALFGVPAILLVGMVGTPTGRSIIVHLDSNINVATAYSRGQGESGISRESVQSVGATAGCRLAYCPLNYSSNCAQRQCSACRLCSPWWPASSNGSRSSIAAVRRRVPSSLPVDSAAPPAPCPHNSVHAHAPHTDAPTLLVVLRGEPFRAPEQLSRWTVPAAAGRPVELAADGGQVRRSDLSAANTKLLQSERADASASHVLRPDLLRLQTAALASVRAKVGSTAHTVPSHPLHDGPDTALPPTAPRLTHSALPLLLPHGPHTRRPLPPAAPRADTVSASLPRAFRGAIAH
jgi:hypothetical protein